jgi:ketosteroid isomerase-like protein
MDVVRAVFAAFAERDVEGVLAHAHSEIEFTAVTGGHAGRTEPYTAATTACANTSATSPPSGTTSA